MLLLVCGGLYWKVHEYTFMLCEYRMGKGMWGKARHAWQTRSCLQPYQNTKRRGPGKSR